MSVHQSDGTLIREIVSNTGFSTVSGLSVGSAVTAKDYGVHITGVTTVTGKINIGDATNDAGATNAIEIGAGPDLKLYHDGSHSYIADTGTGSLITRTSQYLLYNAAGDELMLAANNDGNVELYHNAVKKLETSSSGITVTGQTSSSTGFVVGTAVSIHANGNLGITGIMTASSYRGDGSQLTGISVGVETNAQTGTNAVVTLDLSKQDHKVTLAGISTIDVQGGTEGDAHTVRVVNSGLTTVGFSTYFLWPSGSSPVMPTTSGAIHQISFTVHHVGAAGTQLLAGASLNYS